MFPDILREKTLHKKFLELEILEDRVNFSNFEVDLTRMESRIGFNRQLFATINALSDKLRIHLCVF